MVRFYQAEQPDIKNIINIGGRHRHDAPSDAADERQADVTEKVLARLRPYRHRANREAWELDPGMFVETLPAWVNTSTPRVGAGLGTISGAPLSTSSRPMISSRVVVALKRLGPPPGRAAAPRGGVPERPGPARRRGSVRRDPAGEGHDVDRVLRRIRRPEPGGACRPQG